MSFVCKSINACQVFMTNFPVYVILLQTLSFFSMWHKIRKGRIHNLKTIINHKNLKNEWS